jgi:hypothetical protein
MEALGSAHRQFQHYMKFLRPKLRYTSKNIDDNVLNGILLVIMKYHSYSFISRMNTEMLYSSIKDYNAMIFEKMKSKT